jgi:serine/threonine-protein kinase HipA
VPTISPAYDLVSTGVYPEVDSDLGRKLAGSRRFEDATLATFSTVQKALKLEGPSFADEADRVITSALAAWPEVEATLAATGFGSAITTTLIDSAASMRRRR